MKKYNHSSDAEEETIKQMITEDFETGCPSVSKTTLPRLPNTEATLIAPQIDVRKAQTAFGRLAIAKLSKDMLHHDLAISRQALTALLDLVHDPEKASEAIRINVLPRLVRLMISTDDYTRHHTLCILRVLAGQSGAPQAMVEKRHIIQNLKITLNDDLENVRIETACTLSLLGRSWFSCSCLIENEFVIHILERIYKENIRMVLTVLLEALENILDKSDYAKIQAVQMKACVKLSPLLEHKIASIRSGVLAVYTQIFIIPEGKKAVEESTVHLLEILKKLLDNEDLQIIEHIISFGFLFVTTPLKQLGITLKIIDKLLPIALNTSEPSITKNAMQVITNFAGAPEIKAYLEESWLEEINNINTHCDPDLMVFKNRLISVVTHKV